MTAGEGAPGRESEGSSGIRIQEIAFACAACSTGPTTAWKTTKVKLSKPEAFAVDPDFYVQAKVVEAAGS